VTSSVPYSYKSSISLSAFSQSSVKLIGKIQDLEGKLIKQNLTLNFTVPYSKCKVSGWIPVEDGVFISAVPLMSDMRNYYAIISIENSNYMANEWKFFVDSNIVES